MSGPPTEPFARLYVDVRPTPHQIGVAPLAKLMYLILVGFPLCLMLMVAGVICCMTLIGIPLGLALFATAHRIVRL